ncbi:MAG TPA: ssl1498 family light-harvesting-like protein [Phormidium sp.]
MIGAAFAVGYTIDNQGIINNYAIEPDIYPSDYPLPRQQRQYVFLVTETILFLAALIPFAFSVS